MLHLRSVQTQVARAALGVVLVVLVTRGLDLAGARLEFAAVALFMVVVGTGFLGYTAGLASAATGYLLLLHQFTPPIGGIVVRDTGDSLTGVAFLAGALGTSLLVARLDTLRRRSARVARETELRLHLTGRMLAGERAEALLHDVGADLVHLYGLESCRLRAAGAGVHVDGDAGARGRRRDAQPIVVTAGDVTATMGGGRSITAHDRGTIEGLLASLALGLDRQRLEFEARESRVDAELAHSRAAFLAAVTHDLRTPLSTIKAATAALMVPDSPLSPAERHELLEVAHADAAELDDLITKVLDLARIRSGPVLPQRDELVVDELFESAVRRAQRVLGDRPVNVSVPDELPVLQADHVMLEHALTNLLENAAGHAPADQPIELRAIGAEASVRLIVADHGPGVAEEDRERIFEEFVRVGHDARRGFGLGLTIVRVLVAAHDGTVCCTETPGGGATFVIELPAFDRARDGALVP